MQPNLSEEEIERQKKQEEYKEELAKVTLFSVNNIITNLFNFLKSSLDNFKIQEDIGTLRLVLNDKLKREGELKNLLGITFITEIKNDLSEGLNTVKSTTA